MVRKAGQDRRVVDTAMCSSKHKEKNDMTMFNKVVKSFKYGDHNVRLETGEIARQASGAVIATWTTPLY